MAVAPTSRPRPKMPSPPKEQLQALPSGPQTPSKKPSNLASVRASVRRTLSSVSRGLEGGQPSPAPRAPARPKPSPRVKKEIVSKASKLATPQWPPSAPAPTSYGNSPADAIDISSGSDDSDSDCQIQKILPSPVSARKKSSPGLVRRTTTSTPTKTTGSNFEATAMMPTPQSQKRLPMKSKADKATSDTSSPTNNARNQSPHQELARANSTSRQPKQHKNTLTARKRAKSTDEDSPDAAAQMRRTAVERVRRTPTLSEHPVAKDSRKTIANIDDSDCEMLALSYKPPGVATKASRVGMDASGQKKDTARSTGAKEAPWTAKRLHPTSKPTASSQPPPATNKKGARRASAEVEIPEGPWLDLTCGSSTDDLVQVEDSGPRGASVLSDTSTCTISTDAYPLVQDPCGSIVSAVESKEEDESDMCDFKPDLSGGDVEDMEMLPPRWSTDGSSDEASSSTSDGESTNGNGRTERRLWRSPGQNFEVGCREAALEPVDHVAFQPYPATNSYSSPCGMREAAPSPEEESYETMKVDRVSTIRRYQGIRSIWFKLGKTHSRLAGSQSALFTTPKKPFTAIQRGSLVAKQNAARPPTDQTGDARIGRNSGKKAIGQSRNPDEEDALGRTVTRNHGALAKYEKQKAEEAKSTSSEPRRLSKEAEAAANRRTPSDKRRLQQLSGDDETTAVKHGAKRPKTNNSLSGTEESQKSRQSRIRRAREDKLASQMRRLIMAKKTERDVWKSLGRKKALKTKKRKSRHCGRL